MKTYCCLFLLSLGFPGLCLAILKNDKTATVEVRITRRITSERYTDVNEFQITEEKGTRYCGNATVPKHAVNLPWLKDLRKPAASLQGLSIAPSDCNTLLKWDEQHYCLDRMARKSTILDLVRRCSEF